MARVEGTGVIQMPFVIAMWAAIMVLMLSGESTDLVSKGIMTLALVAAIAGYKFGEWIGRRSVSRQ